MKPERPYKVEYANIKEQSGGKRPPLLSGCTQLKLVTASTLKTPRLLTTVASNQTLSKRGSAFGTTSIRWHYLNASCPVAGLVTQTGQRCSIKFIACARAIVYVVIMKEAHFPRKFLFVFTRVKQVALTHPCHQNGIHLRARSLTWGYIA